MSNVRTVPPPHPAVLEVGEVVRRLEFRVQRRSGPGGQHRNKVATGVFVTDASTGVIAEATESRSQRTNRSAAVSRWRVAAAVAVRTEPGVGAPVHDVVRDRLRAARLNVSRSHPDYPAALALVLDDVWAAGGRVGDVADRWDTSTGRLTRLLSRTPEALAWVNRLRAAGGFGRLRCTSVRPSRPDGIRERPEPKNRSGFTSAHIGTPSARRRCRRATATSRG